MNSLITVFDFSNISILSSSFLEFLKILAWPLITLFIFFSLKDAINSAIRQREMKLEAPGGFKVEVRDQNKASDDAIYKKTSELEQKLEKRDDAIHEIEKMKNSLLFWQMRYYCEHTYRLIFGTQLQMLQDLASGKVVSEQTAEEYYQESPLTPYYPFTEWIFFLEETSYLVEKQKNGNYKLTATGQYFLEYLKDQSLDLQKSG